jgi:hypothetical protein
MNTASEVQVITLNGYTYTLNGVRRLHKAWGFLTRFV